jgi:energy-coupling factor transporter transmembrane protein EcfT
VSAGLPPAPVLLPVAALVTLAFLGDHPLVLVAVLLVAALALHAAGGSRLALIAGAASGIGIALIGPFAGPNGNLILIDGPSFGVIDLQVTVEEVGYGLAAGMRLCAVIWLAAAALAALDPDRLHARATQLAPHSALLLALGARLLPLLRSDARAVGDAARLRGIAPAGGRGPTAVRRAARLYLPLLATSLERGLDQGEALAARGFGHRRVVSLPERPLTVVERGASLGGLIALGAVILAGLAGVLDFTWYPRSGSPWGAGPIAVAAMTALAGVAWARILNAGVGSPPGGSRRGGAPGAGGSIAALNRRRLGRRGA